jgi:hypothetical protein
MLCLNPAFSLVWEGTWGSDCTEYKFDDVTFSVWCYSSISVMKCKMF